MKRMIACLLALALMIGCCPTMATWMYAEASDQTSDAGDGGVGFFTDEEPGEPEITEPPEPETEVIMTVIPSLTEIARGGIVAFSIDMSSLVDCKSAAVTISYDDSVWEYVEGSGACTLSGVMMGSFGMNGEMLSGSFLCATETAVSGEIFRFQMKVKDTAAAESTSVSLVASVRSARGDLPVEAVPAALEVLDLEASVYTYTLENEKATITGVSGQLSGELVIPETLDGYPVVAIGQRVFYGCTGLATVTVPEQVTDIGQYAFAGCTGLVELHLPASLQRIGDYGFHGCDALADVYYSGTESAWPRVSIGNNNQPLTQATIHACEDLPEIPIEPETEASMTIIPSNTLVRPGNVIDFTIEMEAVSGCKSGAVVISYDETVLEYVEGSGRCTLSDYMLGGFGMTGEELSGSFLCNNSLMPISQDVFQFQMKVKRTAVAGDTEISLEGNVRVDGENLPVTAEPVTLFVEVPEQPEVIAQLTVTPQKTAVTQGETVEFSVSMDEETVCKSASVLVTYDENVFAFVDGECTLVGTAIGQFGIVEGKVTGSFAFENETNISGEIFRFRMKVKDTAAAGNTTLSFVASARNGSGDLPVEAEPVTLTVEAPAQPEATVQMTVTPSENTAARGQIITFTISMSELAECRSAGITIAYDESVLEYVEGSGSCLLSGTSMQNFGFISGQLSGSFACSGGKTVSGDIFRFQMKVKETADFGNSTLSFVASARNTGGGVTTGVDPVVLTVVCNHVWSNWSMANEAEHLRTCTVCGETEQVAHQWDAGTITVESNCLYEGVKTYTCTDCTASYTESIPVSGIHTWGAWEVEQAATCTVAGAKSRVCAVCNTGETQTIDALGHDWTEEITDMAHLCTAAENCTGYNTYWYDCSRCAQISDAYAFTSTIAGPHSFTEEIIDAAHMVPGAASALYYYDCAHCDTMGTETYEGARVGDIDNDTEIDEDDAIYLLQHILMPEMFPVAQNTDIDRNGTINEDDAIYLLQHILMPELFPL